MVFAHSFSRITAVTALATQLLFSNAITAAHHEVPLSQLVQSSSSASADAPLATPTVVVDNTLEERGSDAFITMTLQNRVHAPVALDFVNSMDHPNAIIGHPNHSKDTIPIDGNMELRIPFDWQGTIGVGPEGHVDNTLIEGNTNKGDLNLDVSYVQGYSFSVTCWCGGQVVTGCNLDLHAMGSCPRYSRPGICQNPIKDVNAKTPHPFFAPCQHMAFAYPDDGAANAVRTCWPKEHVTCCIGGKNNPCPAHPRQQ
jgi:hypothetical protein